MQEETEKRVVAETLEGEFVCSEHMEVVASLEGDYTASFDDEVFHEEYLQSEQHFYEKVKISSAERRKKEIEGMIAARLEERNKFGKSCVTICN